MATKRAATNEMLTAPLSVSMTAKERGDVRRAAWLSDQSASAFIRAAAVKAATRYLARVESEAKAA